MNSIPVNIPVNTVQCDACHQQAYVMFHFYDEEILVHDSVVLNNEKYYEAVVYGKAICPACGFTIKKRFNKSINKSDIIDLAGGRGE